MEKKEDNNTGDEPVANAKPAFQLNSLPRDSDSESDGSAHYDKSQEIPELDPNLRLQGKHKANKLAKSNKKSQSAKSKKSSKPGRDQP